MAGYDQLVHVPGARRSAAQRVAVDALGQRGHSWGAPDWDRIALARTVWAWLDDDLAVVADRDPPGRGASHHADEAVAATSSTATRRPTPRGDRRSSTPRLSTTYDAEGRQRRAGLELYVDEDDVSPAAPPARSRCGTTLDLGRLRLDCAFFRWRMEGREGVGRYDVLARSDGS